MFSPKISWTEPSTTAGRGRQARGLRHHRRVHQARPGEGRGQPGGAATDEEVEKQLRGLGYIEYSSSENNGGLAVH